MFDFSKTVVALRKMHEELDHSISREEARACSLDLEQKVAADCVAFLYEHMVTRNQLVGAAHLLAHALPLMVKHDPKIIALLKHAVAVTARLDSAAHELVKAAEGTYSAADVLIASQAALPWRSMYWLRAVRLSRVRSALEFGCGHGAHAMQCALNESAVNWTGVDVSVAQADLNRQQAYRVGVPVLFLSTECITRVVAGSVAVLHVLEHTAYPAETLAAAECYVAPQGHVVVVVPEDARAAAVAQNDLDDIRCGVCAVERSHINSMTLPDLIGLVGPRGRLLDACRVQTALDNWDACVVYAPGEP